MKALLAAVFAFLLIACAAPKCPVCPPDDMAILIQPYGIPVVVPKGLFNDPKAETKTQFEKRIKELMKKNGLACAN